jgi:hypothetical protein
MKSWILIFKIRNLKFRLLIGIFILISTGVIAQINLSSPYSALGLGNLSEVNNVRSRSMGGISFGLRDNFTVNFYNPASYTAIDTTSFVFEGGITGFYTDLKTTSFSENYTSATLSHLLFGFPVTKWWKSSFGLLPFSGVGYNVTDEGFNENIGTIQHIFEGSGGLSRFYWGNSIQPIKSLSIGINASYLFGTIDHIQDVSFPDSAYFIGSRTTGSTTVNDIYIEAGIQYQKKLNENLQITAGATFRPKINLGATQSYLSRTYYGYIASIQNFKDTVAYIEDEKGSVVLPLGYGLGVSLGKTDQWLVGFDYHYDQWEDYESFGVNDSLANSYQIAIGGEYIPNINSITSYFQRMSYRLGGHYGKSYLELRNEHLDNFGITFGIGLPIRSIAIRGSKSMLNLGFEYGRKGTLKDGLIQENYANFYLGISIYEMWFFKRRYR